jgi:hypothetical protein
MTLAQPQNTDFSSPSTQAKSRLTLSGAITLVSVFVIIMVQLAAAIAATDWAISTLLGLPYWATAALVFVTAVPTVYAGWLVAILAYKAECTLEA